jgi:hypothetical protein
MKRQIEAMMKAGAAGPMFQKLLLSLIALAFLLASMPAEAQLQVVNPLAFSSKNPANSKQLGFKSGQVLVVGAFVIPGDYEVVEATATNLSSGVKLDLVNLSGIPILQGFYEAFPNPEFDPEQHLGEWEITVMDADGAIASAVSQEINLIEPFPYARGIKAEGSALAPLISWKPPKSHKIPEGCFVLYEIRLLTDVENQYYETEFLVETEVQIPMGTIPAELLEDTWVRTIAWCYEFPPDHPLPFETRSNRFNNLLDLLEEDDGDD